MVATILDLAGSIYTRLCSDFKPESRLLPIHFATAIMVISIVPVSYGLTT